MKNKTPLVYTINSMVPRKTNKALAGVIPDFNKRFGLNIFFEDRFNKRIDLITEVDFDLYFKNLDKGKTKVLQINSSNIAIKITKTLEECITNHMSSREENSWDGMLINKANEFITWLSNHVILEPIVPNITAQEPIAPTGKENYFLDVKYINKSYEEFKNYLFEDLPFNDYLTCFDLSKTTKVITYKKSKKTQFIYFLSQIVDKDLKSIVNDNIALRFGITNYRTSKKHKPNVILTNKVNYILN